MSKKSVSSSLTEREQRLLEYQRITTALARVGSESLTRDKLLHHATAMVSRVTRVRRVKIMRHRPDQGCPLWYPVSRVLGWGWSAEINAERPR
jgi:hypothetical protein